jgi:hypothetical protein
MSGMGWSGATGRTAWLGAKEPAAKVNVHAMIAGSLRAATLVICVFTTFTTSAPFLTSLVATGAPLLTSFVATGAPLLTSLHSGSLSLRV